MVLARIPCTLIHGFFLAPDDNFEILIPINEFFKLLIGKRVQLLDPYYGNMIEVQFLLLLDEIVINLTAAQYQSTDLFRCVFTRFRDDVLKPTQ